VRLGRLAGTTLAALLALGCTARYSQTLIGRIGRIDGLSIANSDSGIELGIGTPLVGVSVITFSEPASARDLAAPPCEIELTQIDYRGTWYAYYVIANFPQVETTSYCVVPAPPSAQTPSRDTPTSSTSPSRNHAPKRRLYQNAVATQ